MGEDELEISLHRTSLRFHRALGSLEPQIYVVLEQFVAEIMPLLSGRLVTNIGQI